MKSSNMIRKLISVLLLVLLLAALTLPVMATVAEEDAANRTTALFGFWITFAFFGCLLPVGLGIFGALMANSRKRGYPRYWWILTMACGAWLLLAFGLALLLILA